ncbi:MAG: PD40 domain-containing protein [Gemmatimonadales bacterium]|nr:PD40 domain-containing protein [Gemmatimonadales bacterium]
MIVRTLRIYLFLLAAATAACSGPGEPTSTVPGPPPGPPLGPLTGAAPFLVSNAGSGRGKSLLGSSAASRVDDVAYISLPPGTVPGGGRATIRVNRTGQVVARDLVDGGFDPVPVPAAAGDTITLALIRTAAAPEVFRFTVPAKKPPMIVRTVPPRNKRDVPLNTRMVVVFSEPIRAGTLAAADIVVRSPVGPIAGRLAFSTSDETTIEFTPDEDLVGSTNYTLVVLPSITDRDGDVLGQQTSIDFTTAPAGNSGLVVTTSTTTPQFAPDSVVLKVGTGYERTVGIGSVTEIRGLVAGPQTISITVVGPNCTVGGEASRVVTITPGTTTPVSFAVTCTGTSPIGQIAFVRDSQLYLINADGTGEVPLSPTSSQIANVDPAWSPDGSRIAFVSTRSGRPRPLAAPGFRAYDIYVMNADGSSLVQRTSTGRYNGRPVWSPDGRQIAFETYESEATSIYVMSADDDGTPPVRLTGSGVWASDPAWTPDGGRIAFSKARNGEGLWWTNSQSIDVMNADGSNSSSLVVWSSTNTGDYERFYFDAAWSPDGRSIAFSECVQNPWSYGWTPWHNCFSVNVLIANADGTGLRPLAPGIPRQKNPTWSPDGRAIAFEAERCCWGEEIRFAWVDGTGGGRIVANGHSPAWRP